MKYNLNESPDGLYKWPDETDVYKNRETVVFAKDKKSEEVYVGKGVVHTQLRTSEIDPIERRDQLKFDGRGWPDKKIISFWHYPESKSELHDFLDKVEDKWNEKVSGRKLGNETLPPEIDADPINFNSNWKIEVVSSEAVEKFNLENNGRIWSDLEYQLNDKQRIKKHTLYISISKYKGFDVATDLRNKQDYADQHVKPPSKKVKGKEKYKLGKALGKKDMKKQKSKQKMRTKKLGYSGDEYEPSMKIKRFREIIREMIKEITTISTGSRIICETPDNVRNKDLKWRDSDSFAFGQHEKTKVVHVGSGKHGEMIGLGRRERQSLLYDGRAWKDSKVISFWHYPEDNKKLQFILDKAQEKYNKAVKSGDIEISKFRQGKVSGNTVNFDSSWKIEMADPRIVKEHDIYNDGTYWFQYENLIKELYPESSREKKKEFIKFVSISDYDGIGDTKVRDATGRENMHIKNVVQRATGKEKYKLGKELGKKDVEKQRKKQKQRTRKLGYSGDDYEPSMKIKRFREIIRELCDRMLNEGPEGIVLPSGKKKTFRAKDSYAFGFDVFDKFKIGNSTTHSNLNLRPRGSYLGRLWLNPKIIVFWDYPENYSELQNILEKIKEKLEDKNVDINFDNDWKIEVPYDPDYSGDYTWDNLSQKQDDIYYNESKYAELIPINKFNGIENIPDYIQKMRDKQKRRHLNPAFGDEEADEKTYDYYKVKGKRDVEKQKQKQKQKTKKLGYSGDNYEPSMKIKRFRETIREIIKEIIR